MTDQNVYGRLADRLDAIPNGFPKTESGVELRLLEKLYTREEAVLAAEMRLTFESAERIAQRARWDLGVVTPLLEKMVQKGLIRAKGEEEQRVFGLMPFVVGIYEAQLSRLDEELAQLFEEYYRQAFAREVLKESPPIHVVVPVEKSIPVEVQVFPYEQASVLLGKAKSFGVRRCICRVQKALVGEPCKFPVENCLVFSPVEGAFKGDSEVRTITRENALQLLKESGEAGLIHSSANIQEGRSYICNCCACCCGIMRGLSQFGIENSIAKSSFHAKVDHEMCNGCGVCADRCQFGAPMVLNGTTQLDIKRCVGCGVCVVTCPTGALTLAKKPEDQRSQPPLDRSEWLRRRAESRGMSLEDG